MSTYRDGAILTPIELCRYDATLTDTAVVERINLTDKLALAQEDLGLDIKQFLRSETPRSLGPAAEPRLSQVWVSDLVRRCVAHRALELFYEDAGAAQLNERYQRTGAKHAAAYRSCREALFIAGVEIVRFPIPQPSMPIAVSAPGQAPAGTYYLAVAFTDSDGREGSQSDSTAVEISDDETIIVSVAVNSQGRRWHVYAGITPEHLTRQSAMALDNTEVWRLPVNGLSTNLPNGPQQEPDYVVRRTRRLRRG